MRLYAAPTAEEHLAAGAARPYDASDAWRDAANEPPLPAGDWAHAAARGVLANLMTTTSRDIRQLLEAIDEDERVELTADLATIIRTAAPIYTHADRRQPAPATDNQAPPTDDQSLGMVMRRKAELATSTHESGMRQLFITDEAKLTEAEAQAVICAASEFEVEFVVPWAVVIIEVEGGWQCFESRVDAATWRRARQESPTIPLAAPAALLDVRQAREASLDEPASAGPAASAGPQ